MEPAKHVARRKHDAELKKPVVAECAVSGASAAGIALEHGLNANLVHRWRRIAEGREQSPDPARRAVEFVALPLPASSSTNDIRIEMRRGATAIAVTWPAAVAAECAGWMRELLR